MADIRRAHGKLILWLGMGCVVMFGFGFALVPLYDVLCDALGINGKPKSEAARYQEVKVDEKRTVEVEFIAQIQPGMPWDFGPAVKRMTVHPGQLVRTEFHAANLSGTTLVGQAIPSVSPGQGAAYFSKTECFCFNQQVLAAKDSAVLPLIFFVDPDLPASIGTLTLSYTLYDITDKSLAGALQAGAAK